MEPGGVYKDDLGAAHERIRVLEQELEATWANGRLESRRDSSYALPEVFDGAVAWHRSIMYADLAKSFAGLYARGKAQLSPILRGMIEEAPAFVFVMGLSVFVLLMTNFIMNVAAIAISLPVALVIAPYLGVAGEVILFSALVTAGMPFLLLVGAAPNAIAYDSGQFTTGEFFLYGIPASIILMIVTGFAVFFLWPLMGMPILTS